MAAPKPKRREDYKTYQHYGHPCRQYRLLLPVPMMDHLDIVANNAGMSKKSIIVLALRNYFDLIEVTK